MSTVRIALANIRVHISPDDSVRLATTAIADARRHHAMVICFPESFIPGYRWPGQNAPPPDPAFLNEAWLPWPMRRVPLTSPSSSAPSV